MIDVTQGLLKSANYVPSPHCDARPDAQQIDISLPPGQFGTQAVQDFFCGKLDFTAHPYFETIASLCVSAHLFIRRTGEALQFVPFSKRAWHAGQSIFQGQERCNDFSIGIELEGTDTEPFTEAQYQQLAKITRELMCCYPAISRERIVGHSDIAPGRKTDPGPFFDWTHFDCLLRV